MSPSRGNPRAGLAGTRSAGTIACGSTAMPIPARTAASAPLTSRTLHVIRQLRPTDSRARMAAAREWLGAG